MPDNDDKKRERLCDLTEDELWEIVCEANQESDLISELSDEFDDEDGEDEDREPVTTLQKEELKAPEGKFRLVFHDMAPLMVAGSEPVDYHWGDFDSLDEAVKKSEEDKPEYGTSYAVYDDKGVNVHENSAIPSPKFLF